MSSFVTLLRTLDRVKGKGLIDHLAQWFRYNQLYIGAAFEKERRERCRESKRGRKFLLLCFTSLGSYIEKLTFPLSLVLERERERSRESEERLSVRLKHRQLAAISSI